MRVSPMQSEGRGVLTGRYLSLNPRVRDSAHLLAVELLPLLAVKLIVEGDDGQAIDEVDERVPDVALVLHRRQLGCTGDERQNVGRRVVP